MNRASVARIVFAAIVIISTASLVACSAAPARDTNQQQGAPSMAPGASASAGSAKTMPAPAGPGTAPQDQQALESANAAAPKSATTSNNTAASWDRMIIRTATLSVIVKDVEAAVAAARDVAVSAGGFVAQSSSRYDGQFQLATITIQVPADQFDATMAALRRQAVKVESENGNTQDVTEEYTDLDAQVRNLQATETSLQRLMDKATRMEDILALQRELTNVRGQIERLQGRMKFLTRKADMSAITLSIRPEAMAQQQQAQVTLWQPLEIAAQAWEASLAVLTTIAGVLIAVLVFAWWVVPVALIGLYVWRTRRPRSQQGTTA